MSNKTGPRLTIVFVKDDDDDESPHDKGYLDYKDEWDEATTATIADVTLEELADLCDRNAEQRNNHTFVGAHRVLASILFSTVGREAATRVMWEGACYGGLDYASGCGTGGRHIAAWEVLGVEEPWKAWKLKD